MEKYEKQLTGEYLEKYEEIEALCQNLSLFMKKIIKNDKPLLKSLCHIVDIYKLH